MRFRSFDRVQSEKRLHNSRLHIEDAGAEHLSAGLAVRHSCQSSNGIDRVVVAEHQQLAARLTAAGFPSDTQMRAAMSPLKRLHTNIAFCPLRRD